MVAAGCGDSVPNTALVVVAGDAITSADLEAATKLLLRPGATTEERRRVRRQMLPVLIRQRWIAAEAEARGIEVSEAQARKAMGKQPADAVARESELYLLALSRTTLLHPKLVRSQIRATGGLGEERLRRHWAAHRSTYRFPERRDMKILAFKTRSAALRAKRQIRAGVAWATLHKTALHDVYGSASPSFALLGEGVPALSAAVFAARKGALVGPVEAEGAWYVFRLTGITPSSPLGFELSRSEIASSLWTQAAGEVERSLRRKYRPLTICRGATQVPQCSAS